MNYKIFPFVNSVEIININLDEFLGRGATGQVFKTQIGNHQYAVKLNHNKNNFNHDKIRFMVDNQPENIYFEHSNNEYPLYSWPISTIYELNGDPVGFVMPLIDDNKSKTLEYFYDYTLSKRLNSKDSIALSYKIKILQNLCSSISKLHKQGVLLIDLKPQNMRVFEGTNIVTLLDCDSYKITNNDNNINYAGEMVSPGYISPELLKAHLSPLHMTIDQDLYALSVIIFQVLNKGIHPFQGILVDDNIYASTDDEKSAAGLYPYGLKKNTKINPKKESIHDSFMNKTRYLFDRAFIQGQKRPLAEEWAEHLDTILKEKLIVRCKLFPNEISHMHFKDMHCPICDCKSNILDDEKNTPISQRQQNIYLSPTLNSFKDVQHIYGIHDIKTSTKSAGSITLVYFLSGLVVVALACFYFLSTDNNQFASSSSNQYNKHQNYNSNYNNYSNSNNFQNNKPDQDTATDDPASGSKVHNWYTERAPTEKSRKKSSKSRKIH